jgi:transposase
MGWQCVVLIVVLLFCVAYLLIRLYVGLARARAKRPGEGDAPELPATAEALLALARTAATSHDYRSAVRYLFNAAVKRVKDGQGIGPVARDLGLVEQTLRNWVKAAKHGKLNPPGGKAVTPEQMELSRMRAENARLRMENEILKKATAYFAKDAL